MKYAENALIRMAQNAGQLFLAIAERVHSGHTDVDVSQSVGDLVE
jgi:hypothetical protein